MGAGSMWRVAMLSAVVGAAGCDGRSRPTATAAQCVEAAVRAAGEGPVERVGGAEFAVVGRHEARGRIGAPTRVSVVAVPCGHWKINLEYPAKLRVVSADSFAAAGNVLALGDAARRDDRELRFDLDLTPEAAGERPVEFHLRFGLCDESRCITRQATIRWTYRVED